MARLPLPHYAKTRSKIIVLLIVAQVLLPTGVYAQSESFVPIPPTSKPLYRFNLEKLFYPTAAEWQKDINEFGRLKTQFEGLKSNATSSATNLLDALELYQKMGILRQRLLVYGELRYSVNISDTLSQREGQKISDDFDAMEALLKIKVQGLTDNQLQVLLKDNAALGVYRFLLQDWRRDQPHTGSEAQETLLAQLSNPLDPFDATFYNLMGTHLEATVSIGNRNLNAAQPNEYNDILRASDRSIRESGFRKRLEAYKRLGDLYSYALLEKIKSANAVSDLHSFPNAVAASLYARYLQPETVDAALKAFKEHASLTIRYQKAERVYQQKLLGLTRAEPWDLEIRPPENPEPRFTISEASEIVLGATRSLKDDYQLELKELLNPANGRLDLVGGKNRVAGDFSWGSYGPTWVFYMNGYNGYLADVVTLGHESAHVVQSDLVYKSNVPWIYSDGARYFMEGLPKLTNYWCLITFSKTHEKSRIASSIFANSTANLHRLNLRQCFGPRMRPVLRWKRTVG